MFALYGAAPYAPAGCGCGDAVGRLPSCARLLSKVGLVWPILNLGELVKCEPMGIYVALKPITSEDLGACVLVYGGGGGGALGGGGR